MKIKSVLITGGAGYVGAVLVPKLLGKKFKVTVMDWFLYGDVFKKYEKNKNLVQVKGDIRDKKLLIKSLDQIDAVIHLACISNDPSFELDPKFGKSINYDATVQLMDLAKKNKIKRFIYASSSSVYGVKKEKEVTEELPLTPLTDYSKYKALSEKYLLKKSSKNFVTLILRPATVCGYSPRLRLDLTVNLLTLQALVNKKITVFGGAQLRPNIHIDDMTDLYLKTLEYQDKQINGKTFNAGYENYSVFEIAKMIKKILKDDIEITKQPTNDLRSYQISSQKIKADLGFIPKHSVDEAIRDLQTAYTTGKILNPFIDPRYINIAMMKKYFLKNTKSTKETKQIGVTNTQKKLANDLLTRMLNIRIIEELIAKYYEEQEMRCPVHLSIGQEAVSAGVGAVVKKADLFLSNHRAHGHYLAKGGDLYRFFAELYGKESGCSRGRGGSMHLIDLSVNFLGSTPIVASCIPVATGVAMAEKIKNKNTVTVVFLGEAVVEEGVFHESINFATLKSLPIIYVCENNLYSVYTPLSQRQPKRSITQLVKAHGANAVSADGNDVLSVYQTFKSAYEWVVDGHGPVFLEYFTYRFREHCGPNFDNHIGYRTEAEYETWKKKDPIERLKQNMLNKKILTETDYSVLKEKILAETETILRKAKSAQSKIKPVTEQDVYAI